MAASVFRAPAGLKGYSNSLAATLTKRNLWGILNPIFNKVDEARIREVGPDRAAAEWLIRCGAGVRWRGMEKFHDDYNTLPSGRLSIDAINANNSCIMDIGFPHLRGLEHLREVTFTNCNVMGDNCLRLLAELQGDRVEKLRIVSCGNITDCGVSFLVGMRALKDLYMQDLFEVKEPENCVRILKQVLTNCTFSFHWRKTDDFF